MMNTLHKSLTIALLAVSIFISGLSANLVSAQSSAPEPMVTLTPEEKSWIKAHSAITLSITDDIPPRSFIDKDGKIKGTTVDYVRLFEQKLGLKINLVGSDWATALKLALDHEVDGILQAAELEERKPYLNFTQVYSYTPQAVIAGEDEPTISGPDALCGRRVGVLKDSSQSRYLMKHFPCINVVCFKALEQVAYALAGKEIHAVFGNYDYYARHFKQAGLVGFKAIYIEYLPPTGFARIGLRNDEPLLLSIFDKAVAAITDDERARITNRWLGLKLPSVPVDLRTRVNLTPEEQAWLAQDHTVRVRVVNLPPCMFLEEDKIKGIAIDYLNLIGQRTGLTFEFSPETRPWQEALKSLKNLQGPDLVTSLSPIAEHEPYMDFSKPYMASARVIFTRTDGEFISSFDDLKGRTLAVPHGTLVHKRIEVEYPDIGLLLYDTDLESIKAVSTGKADAYIGNLIHASFEILQRGLVNLKVAAPCPFGDDVHTFGIRKDWPELSSIINKGLDSITSEEKAAIRSKHLKLKYEYGIKPSDIVKRVLMVAGSASLILLLFLFWNRSLAKQVRERTSELTSSHKLLEVEIDERKGAEERLREGRDYLENLTDSMGDAVLSIKMPERKIKWVNDSFNIFGYTPDECVGKTTEFLYRDNHDFLAFGAQQEKFLAGDDKDIIHIEQVFRRKSGELFPAEVTLTKFRVDKEVVSITGIVRDITDRKLTEEALQESRESYQDLYENAPIPYFSIGTDAIINKCNLGATKMLGYSKEELLGNSVIDLYADTPDGKEKAAQLFKRFLNCTEITCKGSCLLCSRRSTNL
jgi:PAS domain S-box-containing protein